MFSKTLSDGRTATVTRKGGTWSVQVNGQHYTTGTLHELPEPKGPATHVIGSRKVIGFTAAEAAELQQTLDTERAAYLATPAGQRTALAADLDLASGAWSTAREHAADTGDWSKVKPAADRMDAAEAALNAFDAAHPDLVAALQADRQAREEESIRAAFNS